MSLSIVIGEKDYVPAVKKTIQNVKMSDRENINYRSNLKPATKLQITKRYPD